MTFEEWYEGCYARNPNHPHDITIRAAWNAATAESRAEIERLNKIVGLYEAQVCEICSKPTSLPARSIVDERCLDKLQAELTSLREREGRLREAVTELADRWSLKSDNTHSRCAAELEAAILGEEPDGRT